VAGVAERRPGVGEPDEIPVQPHPVEPERVSDHDRPGPVTDLGDPGGRRVHRLSRVPALRDQQIPVKAADRQRVGYELVADRLQLDVERLLSGIHQLEPLPVKPRAHGQAEAEHRVRTGNGPVGLDVKRYVHLGRGHDQQVTGGHPSCANQGV
jgi:hypothetical protein